MLKLILLFIALLLSAPVHAEDWSKRAAERDVGLNQFRFGTGEVMDVRMHVTTLGTPHRDAKGEIDNAIMVLHGTGGTGAQFFRPQFADELYGPGQVLDIAKWYVILPDSIGHGQSSKPSDGLRMKFPRYDYSDMVEAQRLMLTQGLGVNRLQLILGTSMGCMHAFVWGELYPGFARRLAPFACNAMEIGGRNRIWRKLSIDAIKADPLWQNGNYTAPPAQGLRTAADLGAIAGMNPVRMQNDAPTRAQAEAFVTAMSGVPPVDANDLLYQYDSSRNYDPLPKLTAIKVPVLWINSADDFINPPELGFAQQHAKLMPRARFILIPASVATRGHGTHTWAQFWKADLAKLMALK